MAERRTGLSEGSQESPLGWEDPLEEEMATHQFSCLENPTDRGA